MSDFEAVMWKLLEGLKKKREGLMDFVPILLSSTILHRHYSNPSWNTGNGAIEPGISFKGYNVWDKNAIYEQM